MRAMGYCGANKMTDVFISYSSTNRDMAQEMAAELVSLGYSVWWDTNLIAGDRFRETITTRLKEARAVVVIWTEESIRSDWVLFEADAAAKRGTLIPVRISKLPVDRIPPPFGLSHHIITLSDRAALHKALAAKVRTTPAHRIADITRDIYRCWGSTSWGPKPKEVDQIIQAFQPAQQIEMADKLALLDLNDASAVEIMQGWWMLSRLVEGMLALFLTAYLESFRSSLSRYDMATDMLPVGLSLVALLKFIDMEHVFDRDDRAMLNEIALSSEEARLSMIDKCRMNTTAFKTALMWYPKFLVKLEGRLPELQHESSFYG
jgi:hypothetical protein